MPAVCFLQVMWHALLKWISYSKMCEPQHLSLVCVQQPEAGEVCVSVCLLPMTEIHQCCTKHCTWVEESRSLAKLLRVLPLIWKRAGFHPRSFTRTKWVGAALKMQRQEKGQECNGKQMPAFPQIWAVVRTWRAETTWRERDPINLSSS